MLVSDGGRLGLAVLTSVAGTRSCPRGGIARTSLAGTTTCLTSGARPSRVGGLDGCPGRGAMPGSSGVRNGRTVLGPGGRVVLRHGRHLSAMVVDRTGAVLRLGNPGLVWDGTPPVAEQLADHFTRLGLTDTTTQELERRANRVLSGEAICEDWATVRQRLADELAD